MLACIYEQDVSLLKRYKDENRGSAPPPAVLDDGEVECQIDKILAHRDTNTGRRAYYLQWKGLPPEEAGMADC